VADSSATGMEVQDRGDTCSWADTTWSWFVVGSWASEACRTCMFNHLFIGPLPSTCPENFMQIRSEVLRKVALSVHKQTTTIT